MPQQKSPSFVIAISGAAGAGKTTLVRRVAELLDDAVALHFDDYKSVAKYPKYPEEMPQWIKAGRDLNAWEIPQLLDDLKALRNGQTISLPADKGKIGPARVMVLEEPSGRERAGLRELVDFVVLLDIPLDIALARKVVEELHYSLEVVPSDKLATSVQHVINYFSQYPLAREYYLTVAERVRQDCDLILDGIRPTDELAREIVTVIESEVTMLTNQELLTKIYQAFNARDIEAVLAVLHPEVDWPNRMEGGRVFGRQGVRDYWTRQWGLIDPHVEPREFKTEEDGRIVVDVQQVVRDLEGQVLSDEMVQHVYLIQDGLIRSMEVRE